MQNRSLHLPPRLCVVAAMLLAVVTYVNAQSGFFIFTPPPSEVTVNANCKGAASFAPAPTVISVESGVTITISQFAGPFGFNDELYDTGELVTFQWFVQDNLGRSATFNYTLNFQDNTDPVFNMVVTPPTLALGSVAQLIPLGPISVSDNCSDSAQIIQTFSQTTLPPICSSGTVTRSWLAVDESFNTSSYTQVIQIFRDSLQPVITVAPQSATANCATLPGAYSSWLSTQMSLFTATDASGIVSYTNNAPLVYPACPTPITVTFRATDACGLTRTATATFTSSDNAPPVVVSVPKDTVVSCGNHLAALADFIRTKAYSTVTDACSGTLNWTMLVNGAVSDSLAVQDSLLASFSRPCGTQLIGSQVVNKIRGYVRVDFFAEDRCGNDVFVGQGVLGVIDTTGPVATGPAVTTEECGGGDDQSKLITWINNKATATLTDACSVANWTNFSFTTSNGQTGNGNFNAGPYPNVVANSCNWFTDVTFRSTDDCGNTSSRSFRFRVADSTPPAIGGFVDTTVVYCPTALPNTFNASVTDNCSTGITPTFTTAFADTTCIGNYSFKVMWTATDACGNTGNRTQYFVVRDTVRPVFTLVPPAITVSCTNWTTLPNPILGTEVTATDACGALQGLTQSSTNNRNPNPNLCGHYNFEITRTFTATDVCGNTRTATQVVSVRDQQGPGPTSVLPIVPIACQNLPLNPTVPAATDNCGPVLSPVIELGESIVTGNCPDNYTIVVTWQATDVCGNTGTFTQNFLVSDTLKPTLTGVPVNVTVDCGQVPAPPAISSLITSDNCDAAPVVTFVETENRDPNPNSCLYWSNYELRREWTVTDACGNSRVYTQMIQVSDQTAPELALRDTVLMPNLPGQCGANVLPPTPLSVYDFCSVLPQNVVLLDTVPITGPPSSSVPSDTLALVFAPSSLPPLSPVLGAATLVVAVENADANDPTEYFKVFGENGVFIGNTNLAPVQCGSSTTTLAISEAQINEWMADGQLIITLVPNDTGINAINPICSGRRVRGNLGYQFLSPQQSINIQYSIDGAALQTYPATAPVFLSAGTHTVLYRATDCVGNSRTSTTVVVIADVESPLISAPAPQIRYVDVNDCDAQVLIPLPPVAENCDLSGQFLQASPLTNTLFQTNPNAGLVPQTLNLNINGLVPNAMTGGRIRIRHKGDNSNAGEFFRVLDENNVQLSTTSAGTPAGECNLFNETIIPVSAAQINNWAANGNTVIRLIPNTDAFNFSDWINPCGPLTANWDNISQVQAILEYDYAVVNYTVTRNNVVVNSGNVIQNQTNLNLSAGAYKVTYQTQDLAGNMGTAFYNLTVRDTVRPTALCQNRTIFTSVLGSSPYTLTTAEINNNSTDNCGGPLTFTLSQTLFTCNQSGTIVPVTLTVTDTAGNTRACNAMVNVVTENISATASSEICEGGQVQLNADPPGADNNYTYMWSGPLGYMSLEQNPSIGNVSLNQEGTYTVKVTGPTGCTALGVTQVQLIGLPVQPILTSPTTQVCIGEQVILNAVAYNGTNVSYEWYRNSLDTLLVTTIQPSATIVNPLPGSHLYYLRIVDQGCASALSAPLPVNVQVPIAATVINPVQNLCENDPVLLGTNQSGPNYVYNWTGTDGLVSNQAFPPAFPANVDATYTLQITVNGCAGTPGIASVIVKDRPAAPTIIGDNGVCIGNNLTFTAQPATGDVFYWITPLLDTVAVNGINSLMINNLMMADSGEWRVLASLNGCVSAPSAPKLLLVQTNPMVSVSGNSPICNGSVLELEAQTNQPNLNYVWSGPGGFSAFVQAPVDNTPVSGDYFVTVSTSVGCATVDTFAVIAANPPVVTSVTSNAQPCVDGTTDIQLFHTLVSDNGPFAYQWLFEGDFYSALPNPVIPTANSDDNGSYTLIVTDKYGCASTPVSTLINVQNQPNLPIIALQPEVCQGEDVVLTLTNAADYLSCSAAYFWETPFGPITTAQPSLNLLNIPLAHAGAYRVRVACGNCFSVVSADIEVVVNPKPIPPAIVTNSPVCEGDTLFLNATLNPPNLVVSEWLWTGPAGISSNLPNPILTQITPAASGEYFVQVTANGCQSAKGEPTIVTVKPRPQTPVAIMDGPVCLEQADTLSLIVAAGTQTNLATYIWYNGTTMLPLGPSSVSPAFNLSNFSDNEPGVNTFYVIADLDGCSSLQSFPIPVVFDTIPDIQAETVSDFIACVAATNQFDLVATPLSIGNGRWSQIGGDPITLTTPNSPYTAVQGAQPMETYQFVWTISNGACKNYSKDTLTVQSVDLTPAVAGPDLTLCFSSEVELTAIPNPLVPGVWSQPNSQANIQPPIVIENPDAPNTQVTGLPQGTNNLYFFIWTVNSATCGISRDTVQVKVIGETPFAGMDTVVCNTSACATLSATPLKVFETGMWRSADPNISFSAIGNANTVVCGLQPGQNLVYWETNGGFCNEQSTDEIRILYDAAPAAQPDVVAVNFGVPININLIANDVVAGQATVTILNGPGDGQLTPLSDLGAYRFEPLTFQGNTSLTYELCNLTCPDPLVRCSAATVEFNVGVPIDCDIPTVITPNGDGSNDVFYIPLTCLICADCVQRDNTLTIFNQWGDVVFHAKDYQQDWNGQRNGEDLPVGSYFYVLEFFANSTPVKQTGFVILQR
jgi:gliding motility-associated-like protein